MLETCHLNSPVLERPDQVIPVEKMGLEHGLMMWKLLSL